VTISTNMAGRGTDIMLGGNPLALAHDILERHLLAELSMGAPPHGVALGVPPPELDLHPATKAALTQAAGLVRIEVRVTLVSHLRDTWRYTCVALA
jgi:preprotein translocase subunit SecA